MKSEPKAFASLSSGLLARKGAARPAMRPQGFGQATGSLDDLGWNDMGFDPPKPSSTPPRDLQTAEEGGPPRVPFAGLTPLESPVHTQQAKLADRLSAAEYSHEVADEAEEPVALAEAPPPSEAAQPDKPVAEVPAVPAAEPFGEEGVSAEPAPDLIPVARKAPQAPTRMPRPRAAPGANGKAAFTLRLDPDRHLKLRLACAVGGRSAQQLVTDALDQLLAEMPELDAMAARAKRKGS